MQPVCYHRHIDRTNSIHLTRHAQCRAAQRAIPPSVVEQLLVAGKRDFDHRGGVRVHLHQRSARQRFINLAGQHTADQYRNAYVVVDCTDPRLVITVGWCELTRRTDRSPHRQPRR
jgi:Domain of unknown function (DUF4258)